MCNKEHYSDSEEDKKTQERLDRLEKEIEETRNRINELAERLITGKDNRKEKKDDK